MRPFPSPLGGPAAQAFLLVSSPAPQLACATPFPAENLATGMTTETAYENLGGPEAIDTNSLTRSSCTYTDQAQWWALMISLQASQKEVTEPSQVAEPTRSATQPEASTSTGPPPAR
jgi:poly(3-hydroxybutyrate) depolymerase